MRKLFSFDVRLKDLESLRGNNSIKVRMIMDFLETFWFEGQGGLDPEYWDRVRIGSVDVYLDDQNHLHLDFVTRFHLGNYPEIIKVLKLFNDENEV
jgi:hypothetical protein